MKQKFTQVIQTVMIITSLTVFLTGCGSQIANVPSQPAKAANSATQSDSKPLTPQDVKAIDIKTSQGKAQVDAQLDKTLSSLDHSLQNLEGSMGRIQ